MKQRWWFALGSLVLVAPLMQPNQAFAEESLQAVYERLRVHYAGPQGDWPEPHLDEGVKWAPLAALPEQPSETQGVENPEALKELGRLLFFEPLLSGSGQIACASCHDPDLGWADGRRFSFGHDRQRGELNSPTVLNAVHLREIFWDGRADSLEQQAVASLLNPIEMAGDPEQMAQRLNGIDGYRKRFQRVFEPENEPSSSLINLDRISSAIAGFVRSLNTPNTSYDRFMRGDRAALSDRELHGLHLFRTRARCMNCHNGPLLSDGQYHHLGTSFYGVGNYQGRYAVSGKTEDFSAFRTSPLRNVAHTAPYMHNGLINDLDHLVALYVMGWWQNSATEAAGKDPRFAKLSPLIQPLTLNREESSALVAFLKALGTGGPRLVPPVLPRPAPQVSDRESSP